MGTKFSVIVPIYGVEEYLPKCIESVLAQSYDSFQLILVDDGSKDASGLLCDKYAEQDTRIICVHKENGGLVSARIAGVKIASGEYCVCLDGDDWLEGNYLRALAEVIDLHHPDVVCTGYTAVFPDHKDQVSFPIKDEFLNRRAIENCIFPFLIHNEVASYFPPSVWAKAFKTDLYRKYQCKVNPSISIGEDFACTIPIIAHCNTMCIVRNQDYCYRQNNASMTKAKRAFDWYGPKTINQHIRNNVDLSICDFEEQLVRKTLHSLFNVVCTQFFRKEAYSEIRKDILTHLSDELYRDVIKHATFAFPSKAYVMKTLLKYRLFLIMKGLADKRM